MAYTETTPLAEEPRLGTGVSATVLNFGDLRQFVLLVRTENFASGNVSVTLEDSVDGVNWFFVDAISISAAGQKNVALRSNKPTASDVRLRWSVSNTSTPISFTAHLVGV